MPKVNLPLGSYGIFIPAFDGAWAPPQDAVQISPGVWAVVPGDPMILNLTKFLQQFAHGPNAALGGVFGAGMLTGFDVAYSATTARTVTAAMYETAFINGVVPAPKNASNTPQFVLIPANPVPLPASSPANAAMVARVQLTDYWLIGQNGPDTLDILSLTFSGAVNLFGVTIYFGDR